MQRTMWIGVAVLAAACGGNNSASRSGNTARTAAQGSQAAITVTGCLRQANQIGGGTVGTAGSGSSSSAPNSSASSAGSETSGSSAGDQFILATTSNAAGSTGAASTATTGTAGSSYMLEGDSSELRQHLNQQVQISGRLDTAGGATGSGAASGSSTAAQRLRVESVQMIASACSTQ